MAYRGDVISCTVKFELARDGKVPIVFSLNGRQITLNDIFMDYTQNEEFLYPYIGMGHKGIRVLAKVSTRFGVKEVAVIYITQLYRLLLLMIITIVMTTMLKLLLDCYY